MPVRISWGVQKKKKNPDTQAASQTTEIISVRKDPGIRICVTEQ